MLINFYDSTRKKVMGDLHSIAYTRCSPSLISWDLHSLDVPDVDMSFVMDSSSASFFSSVDYDLSTGYLEDALTDFKERSKRRRLQYTDGNYELPRNHATRYYNPNIIMDVAGDSCMHQVTFINKMSDGLKRTERTSLDDKQKRVEETFSALDEPLDSSSSSCKYSENTMMTLDTSTGLTAKFLHAPEEGDAYENKPLRRVVYPFSLVKPEGVPGNVTLNDINERILMRPTRPVRHPVGNFACRPCVSTEGPSLSGKTVVALTRIQTHGRGTVTIIRTKG